jgi:IS5 family transposase
VSTLEAKGQVVKSGTIVDVTIIAAPPSTKNKAKARDPEMRQTRQGQDWHFGMKLHIGTDLRGTGHTVTVKQLWGFTKVSAVLPRTWPERRWPLHW